MSMGELSLLGVPSTTNSPMFSLHDIVAVAIQIEQNGEQTYREAAAKVGAPKLAKLLNRLAEQEVAHVTWFTELQEALPPSEVEEELAEMLGKNRPFFNGQL